MEKTLKFIIENINTGNINKQIGIELLTLLKKESIKINEDIAIIGMALKMPMADTLEEYWENIKNGKDCITQFPTNRREDAEKYLYHRESAINDAKYYDAGFLNEIDKFDYKFFRMTPKQAALMDPNQRLLLEIIYKAIEDAGYGGSKLVGSKTGVYVGHANNDVESYGRQIYELEPESIQVSMTGILPAILPSRISYLLDLKGPTYLIDTACSSALTAIHLACQGLSNGDCDMAIVAGVRLVIIPIDDENRKLGIESSTGRTMAFDERADGAGLGEGVAAIILKPLSKALEDRDNIYAVIKSSAVNQDGTSAGITAPNSAAQGDVIVKAWRDGGIDPKTISYIEAHGTGTRIGDPIEIEGIQKAFRKYTDKKQFCAIGSVKTNIGHLFECAGLAGIIKVVLAMKNKQIPPTINFEFPNSRINFEESPVYIVDKLTKWDKEDYPRRAGISAFGFSGTNAHIVLEEAPEVICTENLVNSGSFIFTLSAKGKNLLNEQIKKYYEYLNSGVDYRIGDICYTASTGRGHYNFRLAFVVGSVNELKECLETAVLEGIEKLERGKVFFGEHKISQSKQQVGEVFELTEEEKKIYDDKAKELINEYIEKGKVDRSILEEICKLYVEGADIVWDDLYKDEDVRKVSLPTYQFERTRCWLDLPEIPEYEKKIDKDHLYFGFYWEEDELQKKEITPEQDTVLILKDENGKGEILAQILKEYGRKVKTVSIGEEYKKLDDDNYIARNKEDDFVTVLNDVEWNGRIQIVHMLSLGVNCENGIEGVDKKIESGVISLYYLTRAIMKSNISKEVELSLISNFVSDVTGSHETIVPENAALFGLGRAIRNEISLIKCRCIDIDEQTELFNIAMDLIINGDFYETAYRNGKRYVQKFDSLDIKDCPDKRVEIKSEGVYIITGGLGGIALAVAKSLALKNKVNIALISRSKIPEREKWDEILNDGTDKKLCNRIIAIKEIEELGSKVTCFSADVKDIDKVSVIVEKLRQDFGKINGIIHSAGIPGDNFVVQKEEKAFREVLSPKIHGTWILDKLTEKDDLDFLILFSSVASVLPAPGQGDYAAANAYLDSFAAYRENLGKRTLVVNWVAWKETGMAYDTGTNIDTAFKALYTDKAIDALFTVLNKGVQRVLIGELNYDDKMIYLLQKYPLKISERIKSAIGIQSSKEKDNKVNKKKDAAVVELRGRSDNDYTETEKLIGQIWSEALGYTQIDINDNFIELGGDSIMAMNLVTQIAKATGVKLNISEVLSYMTIYELAKYMDEKYLKGNSEEIECNNKYAFIGKSEEREYYPLSAAQKRMYLLNQLDETSTNYNLTEVMLFEGDLDIERFEDTIKKLIKRHEIFRTTYELVDGEPVQKIHNDVEFYVEHLTINEREVNEKPLEDIAEHIRKSFVRPFNLSSAPLLRVGVAKLGDGKYLVIIDRHHIISDAVSRRVFKEEFVKLYIGENLPEPKLQYRDYSIWQNELRNKGIIKKQEEYWLDVFKGKLPVLNIPTDFERPKIQSFEGDKFYFTVDEKLKNSLDELAAKTETTLFMILISAYNILLSKYSGSEDIIVGTPMAGREHPDLENMMGMLVNTVALRSYPSYDKTFEEFLREVKINTLRAMDNQEYQFDELVEKLGIERDPGRNPLFDTLFVLQNVGEPEVYIDNIKLTNLELKNNTSKFDLSIEAYETQEKIFFNIEYCTKLFKKETINRFSTDYIKILNKIADNSNIKIGDISLIEDFNKLESVIDSEVNFSF